MYGLSIEKKLFKESMKRCENMVKSPFSATTTNNDLKF